jgi:hypothetical protein
MDSSPDVDELLVRLQLLESSWSGSSALAQQLHQLRIWQTERLLGTYDDLHRDPRYSEAMEFFVRDVYGPHDFTLRNRDMARAWSQLKRALPKAALAVLSRAIELEVLTAELDREMAAHLVTGPLTALSYAAAYRAVARRDARERQIDLLVGIGAELAHIIGRAWIGLALRAAHIPAHAAGFGVLQDFLERGFAAFRKLQNPQGLLEAIRDRETQIMEKLFRGDCDPFAITRPQDGRNE